MPVVSTTEGGPAGPGQTGRGCNGQYVYWITMVQPTAEVVDRWGLRRPEEFSREEFGKFIVKAHKECDIAVVETACFMEPHASGKPHHNCLARASTQYKWKAVAEKLFYKYKVSVNFGTNIRTWAEGVVYGKVGSEHKGPESLDQSPIQWAASGTPAKLEECIPRKWRQEGFVRKTKMSQLAFLDICRKHVVKTETQLWALASQLEEESGDRGLQAFLFENDAAASLEKARKAMGAKEDARREKMTRLEILGECARGAACTCKSPGLCYRLMKDILGKNGIDGPFQKEVCDTLEAGRHKQRNLCILGSTDMAKSFLFYPLQLIYKTYTRPDGGTHQLELLLGKELVFLNDFEFDEDAKKWMCWGFLKRFLEGGSVTVAVPKSKGTNQEFTADAPVFMTAPQEVALYRGKRRDEYETDQMRARVKYQKLSHTFEKKDRVEADPCAKCGAELYLEGRNTPQPLASPAPQALPLTAASSSASASAETPPRTGVGMVQALKDLKELKDAGILDTPELHRLKAKVLRGD